MFNSPPKISSISNSYKTWERIGPINIDDIIKYSDFPVIINDEMFEFGFITNGKLANEGQILKKTGKINGVARNFSIENDYIFEGLIYRNSAEGYGRYIKNDGSYYLGSYKDNKRDGYGTLYNPDGEIVFQGIWVK
jgi:hypothetical protein